MLEHGIYQKQKRAGEDRYITQRIRIGKEMYHLFAVLDGHGGPFKEKHIVDYCVQYLAIRLFTPLVHIDRNSAERVSASICRTFLDFDTEMYSLFVAQELDYGTTCTAVILDETRKRLYQINLGDSRSIIFVDSTIISETKDHKPQDKEETIRIIKAGGHVFSKRVNGDLAVSRSFGDYFYKLNILGKYNPLDSPISALPDVIVTEITSPLRILLTSDAPFEVPHIDNVSLVTTFNEALIKMRTFFWKESSIFHRGLAMGVADSFSDTTDDTTVMIVSVNIIPE